MFRAENFHEEWLGGEIFTFIEDIQRIRFPLYGVSKLAGEYYCRVFSDRIHTVIVRPFNVFSPRMDPNNPYSGVIVKFISRVRQKLPPVIYGDGKQTRDFVHVKDVVDFVEKALEKRSIAVKLTENLLT